MCLRWRNIFFFEGIVGTPLALIRVNPIDKGFVGDRRMQNPGVFPRARSLETCMFLSERERWIAAERMRIEHREVGVACNGCHTADGHWE